MTTVFAFATIGDVFQYQCHWSYIGHIWVILRQTYVTPIVTVLL